MSLALTAKASPLPPPPRLLDRHRGISFHEERFSWLRFEAEHLFEAHDREASADLSVPLAVNWPLFGKLEEAGLEVCVVARSESYPVGYAVFIMFPNTHYDTLVGSADALYVDPRFRSSWIALRLLRAAEKLLKERGVQEVWNGARLHVKPGRGTRDVGVLYRWLGYRPYETLYRKRL